MIALQYWHGVRQGLVIRHVRIVRGCLRMRTAKASQVLCGSECLFAKHTFVDAGCESIAQEQFYCRHIDLRKNTMIMGALQRLQEACLVSNT